MTMLHAHLKEHGISQRKFAAMIGKDQSIVSRIASGAITPSIDVAFAIQVATGGAVPIASWVKKAEAAE